MNSRRLSLVAMHKTKLGLNLIFPTPFRDKSMGASAHGLSHSHERRCCFHCFGGFASRKSFTIGTMTGMRSINVTCVVFGKMANLDAERGRMSP
jgi:predicted alpha/beta hydrolase